MWNFMILYAKPSFYSFGSGHRKKQADMAHNVKMRRALKLAETANPIYLQA